MKTIKGLLLGAAAALSMGSVASAADLPAAEPVEYVRICDGYGAGYFFIPGTDTCLRISGYVRFQVHIHDAPTSATNFDSDISTIFAPVANTKHGAPAVLLPGGTTLLPVAVPAAGNFFERPVITDGFDMWTRALLRFDARTRTEWGVLRSFIEFAASGDNSAAFVLRYAFVQFGLGGGIVTAGLSDSFFAFEGAASLGTPVADPAGVYFRRNVLGYSATFGGGISASIALEDSTSIGGASGSTGLLLNTQGFGTGIAATPFLNDTIRDRVTMPDLTGNIRIAQSWGAAQISGAVGRYEFVDPTCAVPGLVGAQICEFDQTGWAVRAGLRLNLDALSRGSNLILSAAYADGAINYLGAGFAASGLSRSFYQSTFNALGVADNTRISRVDGYSLFGAFQYFFTPALRSSIFGGYAELGYDSNAFELSGNTITLNRAYSVGANVIWSPVAGLDLGVEVFYVNLEYGAVTRALGTVATTEVDGWGGIFRIQRNF